jgi:DNA mismatch repair protein MSH2
VDGLQSPLVEFVCAPALNGLFIALEVIVHHSQLIERGGGMLTTSTCTHEASSFASSPKTIYLLRCPKQNAHSEVHFELHGEQSLRLITPILPRTTTPNQYTHFQVVTIVNEVLQRMPMLSIELWEVNNNGHNRWISTATPGNPDDLLDRLMIEDSPVTPSVASLFVMETSHAASLAVMELLDYTLYLIPHIPVDDTFSQVETILVQLGVREVLTPVKYAQLQMADVSVEVQAFPMNDSLLQDLGRLTDEENGLPIPGNMPTGLCKALSSLLSYLRLDREHVVRIAAFQPKSYMRLDETALRALHVFAPCKLESRLQNDTSLFGILSKACSTNQGKRTLERWLRQPLLDTLIIHARQDKMECLMREHVFRLELQEGLKGLPDTPKLVKKVTRGTANLADMACLYDAVNRAPSLLKCLSSLTQGNGFEDPLNQLHKLYMNCQPYVAMLNQMIDWSAVENHEWLLLPSFDPQLTIINDQRGALMGTIQEQFMRVSKELGLEAHKKLKLERSSQYGYHLRISRLDAAVLESKNQYMTLVTHKNGILFTSAPLKTASDAHEVLGREYERQQLVLVQEMLKIADTYRIPFLHLDEIFSELDALQSMSMCFIGSSGAYVRPVLTKEEFDVEGVRHPCINTLEFIPNDIHFDRPQHCLSLITGPNMGGKSTYIRSCALVAILSQIGAFVPATKAHLPLFDAVLVRVGAGDDVFRGLSTFAMEMRECATIIKSATPHSLVIIDELGRGTSTEDGLAIAWSIAHHLAVKVKCVTLFATHFHELTLLTEDPMCMNKVQNIHAVAHLTPTSINLLYKIAPGPGSSSLGLHCATLAGMPSRVVRFARFYKDMLEGSITIDEEMCAWVDKLVGCVEEGGRDGQVDDFLRMHKMPSTLIPYMQDEQPDVSAYQ